MNPKSFRPVLLAIALFMATAAGAAGKSVIERAMEADKAGKHKKALSLYIKAAEGGDTKAMTSAGLKYYMGEGTKQDYCAAYDWFNKARDGDADALNNIGVMFRDGQCVGKNRKIAYLTFLIIHMEGMGAQQTQLRANRSLRQEMAEISRDDMHEALCYTLSYYKQAIGTRGENMTVSAEHMPSENNLRFKETGWWLPHEREALNFECPEPWSEVKAAQTRRQDGQAGAAPAGGVTEQIPATAEGKKK